MSQQSLSHNESKTTWVTFLAVGIVIVALVLYYILIDQSIWVRLAILFGGIALAVGIVAISPEGKRFIVYARESWYEVKKVVWPTRKEATQMTLVVFGFVLIMSLFLWFADKLIEWLVFSVLLGWK
jgi:preprotein translocase subunit SecE